MNFYSVIVFGFVLAVTQANIASNSQMDYNQINTNTQSEQSDRVLERGGNIDSYGAPQAPLAEVHYSAPAATYSAPAATYSAPQATYSAPQATYSAPQASYQEVPVFHNPAPAISYSAPVQHFTAPIPQYHDVGCRQSSAIGGFGPDFLKTALQVMLGLFAFSLFISIITKVVGAKSGFLNDIFDDDRSLDQGTVEIYTNMALNGIEKAKQIYENINN